MPKFDSKTGSDAGKKSKKVDPVKKQLDSLLNDLLTGDNPRLNANDLWADIEKIENPAQRFDRKLALLEFKLPKPRQIEFTGETEQGVYIIGGLPRPQYESNG